MNSSIFSQNMNMTLKNNPKRTNRLKKRLVVIKSKGKNRIFVIPTITKLGNWSENFSAKEKKMMIEDTNYTKKKSGFFLGMITRFKKKLLKKKGIKIGTTVLKPSGYKSGLKRHVTFGKNVYF